MQENEPWALITRSSSKLLEGDVDQRQPGAGIEGADGHAQRAALAAAFDDDPVGPDFRLVHGKIDGFQAIHINRPEIVLVFIQNAPADDALGRTAAGCRPVAGCSRLIAAVDRQNSQA